MLQTSDLYIHLPAGHCLDVLPRSQTQSVPNQIQYLLSYHNFQAFYVLISANDKTIYLFTQARNLGVTQDSLLSPTSHT